MRICSFLPGATEIAFSLGLGDQIVGVTHECDYPHEAKQKRVVVRSAIDANRMTGAEIDRKVGELLAAGKGLYTIDEEALVECRPDIILTQGLCEVCALDYDDVVRAARSLPGSPQIVSLTPHSLTDVIQDVARVGAATRRESVAEERLRELRARIERVAWREPHYRPRVVCLEWFEPLYVAGHWVPEMVTLAGGHDVLGRAGAPSFKVNCAEILEAKPEVILLLPCGFDTRRTVREAALLRQLDHWSDLPAVRAGHVYALNGGAYFSRPGPRLVNGLEILARIIQPEQRGESLPDTDGIRLN